MKMIHSVIDYFIPTQQLKQENKTMFLTIIILGVLAACAFEALVMKKVPPLYNLCKKAPIVGVAASIIISMGIGHIFGAAGMVVMVMGLISTVVTAPFYFAANAWENRKQPKLRVA